MLFNTSSAEFSQEENTLCSTNPQSYQAAWQKAINHITWFVSLLDIPLESELVRAAQQAITLPLAPEEYATWHANLLALAKQTYQDNTRKTYEAAKQERWYTRFKDNTEEAIEFLGSDRLQANILYILNVFKEKRPFRYTQILQSFKRIEFVQSDDLIQDWTGYRPPYRMAHQRANSNGYFTIDGGEPGQKEFWAFTRTFLHECGHNINGHFLVEVCESTTTSEREGAARLFAQTVLREFTGVVLLCQSLED